MPRQPLAAVRESCAPQFRRSAARGRYLGRVLEKLNGKALNVKMCPLAPAPPQATDNLSAVQLAQRWRRAAAGEGARIDVGRGDPEMFGELCSIRGVGPKIASFFLRDVALNSAGRRRRILSCFSRSTCG